MTTKDMRIDFKHGMAKMRERLVAQVAALLSWCYSSKATLQILLEFCFYLVAFCAAIIIVSTQVFPQTLTLHFWTEDLESHEVLVGILVFTVLPLALFLLRLLHKRFCKIWTSRITDPFVMAKNQLALNNRFARLGAIRELERIAKDDPTKRSEVLDILAAYLREKAQCRPLDQSGIFLDGSEVDCDTEQKIVPPSSDVFAALFAILRTIDLADTPERYLISIDLINIDLRGLDACGVNLSPIRSNGDIKEIKLRHTNFIGSNLAGAFVKNTDLSFAYFCGGCLKDADLINADLTGANLSDANLEGAILLWANLNKAIFENARGLTQKQLNTICHDSETPPIRLPDGLILPDPKSYGGPYARK